LLIYIIMTMLEFLRLRKYKIAARLNFQSTASANNQIANFALASFEYRKLYFETNGVYPPDDENDVQHTEYYNRVKYNRGRKTDLKAGEKDSKAKTPVKGRKAVEYARSRGQENLIEDSELDALANEIASLL